MTELIFYTHPLTTGRIVRWMLEEIGIAYRTELIDVESDYRPAAFLARNPIGKVPVLVHGETTISETAAICAYLADAFPAAGLAPAPDSPARGDYYRWLFFAAGPFDTATTLESMALALPPHGDVRAGWGTLDRVIAMLDHALCDRDYLAGDAFSAADIYLGSRLDWAMRFGSIAEREVFRTYVDRLWQRPAARRAHALDAALTARPILTAVR